MGSHQYNDNPSAPAEPPHTPRDLQTQTHTWSIGKDHQHVITLYYYNIIKTKYADLFILIKDNNNDRK